MFTLPNKTKVLNLPEQVELNKEHIEANETAIKQNTSDISNHNQFITSVTSDLTAIHNDINNINSPDGTITTGTLDVEKKATFGSDAEVDGKLIVNSVDDITDKDGNPIVKNESIDEFRKNYYATAGMFRFAHLHINAYEGEDTNKGILDPESTKWTNLTQQYANSGFYSFGTLVKTPVQFPDFGTTGSMPAYGLIDGFENDYVVFGNARLYGFRLFEGYQGKSIMVKEGKIFKVYGDSVAMFNYNQKLEEIGALDLSEVTSLSVAFSACYSLKHIHCTHFKVSFNISASTAFETDDLVEIISNLDTVTTAQTLTMGSVNLAKLTQNQILVATGKGWTLA